MIEVNSVINFSSAKEVLNSYSGSEKKKTLIYNDKRYLVKFPDPVREKNKNISYINNAFSEYIGSRIFQMVGIPVQNTLLGIYEYNGKKKIVCACEDFTDSTHDLYEFERLTLSINPDKKIDTELSDIMDVIFELSRMTTIEVKDDIKSKFWDMFIIDFLIGNTDRHNGNWGFLMNLDDSSACFSPIYDCGSCLNPILEDIDIERLKDKEIKNLSINCYSCIKENGKRINYTEYIKSLKNSDCNSAVGRVFNKIDISKINSFIDGISCMSQERRNFYKRIICFRYEILKKVYERISR